ncbi:MAG: extracellular solute-binding protein [Spirochaetes bacterium]|nr:extracellular solute-binding protein [Spirochaetota bacterium]
MNTRRVVPPVLAAVLLLAGCAPQTKPLRPLVAPKPTEGMVVYVSGGVRASRDSAWVDVEPGDTVGAAAVLRTDADGYCELQFGDTVSVRVEPETEFRCGSVALDGKAAVNGELTAGAILAKVKKLSGSDLQVRTPSAVVGVRGTAFKVSVSGNATTVTVREGTVRVAQEGTTVNVDAGRRAEMAPDAAPTTAPAATEDLEAIDAFVPSTVETADVGKLVKVLVVVEPADAEIWLGSLMVGRGTWGAVLEEGTPLTLYLKLDGYGDDHVNLPEKRGTAARIVRKLKPLAAPGAQAEPAEPAAQGASTEPAPEAAIVPAQPATAPETVPEAAQPGAASAPAAPSTIVEQPLESPPAAGVNLAFRVDPAIGNDPFFREMAALFARRVPRFSLVTGPASTNLAAPAWPRGTDLVGGMDNSTQFTYERLPQLVAAKLVQPLDSWFEWTQLAPVLVDAVRVGGRVYGVPIGGLSPILYYNKDFVREAPRAWTDITALAAEYAQKGGDALAMPSLVPFFMGMFPESRDVPLLVPGTARTALGSPQAATVYNAMREALEGSAMSIGLPQEAATALFRDRKAALLIDGPWSFGILRSVLGGSLGVARMPSWGSPGKELTPYANVLAMFVSTGVSEERAIVLRRFFAFLLEEESQLRLVDSRLAAGSPIAPARRFVGDEAARLEEKHEVVSALYRQLETARPMPRGLLADDAWRVFEEVLEGIRRQEGGEMLARMADARFLLYGLERRPLPAGARELRAVIDPAETSQGLFFRPWDEESDLRLVDADGSRGVVSIRNLRTPADRGEQSYVYLVVSHAPYRAGKAPPLRGRIEYFDEPNASLRIVYDSKDTSVRENPKAPDTWGAWKEAAFIACTGTREWKTADFPIPDSRFDRRCNGADLRIEVMSQGKVPPIRSVVLTPVR